MTENPDLRDALKQLAKAPSAEAESRLLACLKDATFLAAILVEGTDHAPATEVDFIEVTQLRLVSAESDGQNFLPLFTDLRALSSYTKRPVAGMRLTSAEAFHLAQEKFDGAVINPANDALPLSRKLIESLLAPPPRSV